MEHSKKKEPAEQPKPAPQAEPSTRPVLPPPDPELRESFKRSQDRDKAKQR